jgi:hypothetical protein
MSMPKKPERGLHYLVEFASRYGRSPFKTLTAEAALWRAEALAEDARQLLEVKAANSGGRLEITSYYAVGLVTCLEWHGRSRLVDLMTFLPSCIESNDIKNVPSLAISQMASEGASIPQLLGAATNVSQLSDYLRIFKRLFEALDIGADIERELRSIEAPVDAYRLLYDDTSLFGALDRLFATRNHLVHEIDISIIGAFSIRETWPPEEAIQYADAVIKTLKTIELHITKSAPTDFPHRLGEDGIEEDELEKLTAAVSSLEVELTTGIEKLEGDQTTWREALAASQFARNQEIGYLEESIFLRPLRHLNMRRSFQVDLLRGRLTFLQLLKSQLPPDQRDAQ